MYNLWVVNLSFLRLGFLSKRYGWKTFKRTSVFNIFNRSVKNPHVNVFNAAFG